VDRDWAKRTKGLLRAEMVRRQVSYRELAELLGKIGVKDTEQNLRNKVHRGAFTAIFLVQALTAMGVQSLRLDES
jgi:hypothetical protein